MAVEGCLIWQKEGLNMPDEVKEATDGTGRKWILSHRSLRNAALWRRQESLQ